MRMRFKMVAAVTACTALTAACGSSSKKTAATATTAGGTGTTAAPASSYPPIPPGPIKFGISTPLTGAQAAFGQTTSQSFNNITLKAFNAAHPDGIDGHQVTYEVLDDASDVTKAVSVANQMVADKLAGVITISYNPAATDQQMAIFNKAHMPVVANINGKQYSDAAAWPYAFAVSASIQQEGDGGGRVHRQEGLYEDRHPHRRDPRCGRRVECDYHRHEDRGPPGPGREGGDHHPRVDRRQHRRRPVEGLQPRPASQLRQLRVCAALAGHADGPVGRPTSCPPPAPGTTASAGWGTLVNKAVSAYSACADTAGQTWPPDVAALQAAYNKATGGFSTNYMTYVISDSIPLELLKVAIEKYHSVDPAAIKKAMEGINQQFFGAQFTITPTNHYGLTGQYGAAVCNMGQPYAGGLAKVPVKSS